MTGSPLRIASQLISIHSVTFILEFVVFVQYICVEAHCYSDGS